MRASSRRAREQARDLRLGPPRHIIAAFANEEDWMKATTISGTRVRLTKGDITTVETDAMVNAANSALGGGGGVDGAIHRAGGPSIMSELDEIRAERGRCEAGDAVVTGAGDLPAANVIHAVGPVWRGGNDGEYIELEQAYARSLEKASKLGAKRVSLPSISTGAYRFPVDRAAQVALGTVARFVSEDEGIEEVIFVLFTDADVAVYAEELDELVRTKLGT